MSTVRLAEIQAYIQTTSATAVTVGAGPIASARTNLLFPSLPATWTTPGGYALLTANMALSPDGSADAVKLTETAVTQAFTATVPVSGLTSGVAYTASIVAKAGEEHIVSLGSANLGGAGNSAHALFDLGAGTVVSAGAGLTAAIAPASLAGWYLISITGTLIGTSDTVTIGLANASGATSYAGTTTFGAFFGQAQYESGSSPTATITTTTAAVTLSTSAAAYTQVFALAGDYRFPIGTAVAAVATANPLAVLSGTVTAYDPSTQFLTVAVTGTTSTGLAAYTGWTVSGVGTFLFGSGAGYNDPTAPGYYQPDLILSNGGSETIFGDYHTFGTSQVSPSSIKISNGDDRGRVTKDPGRNDHLRRYAYRGRPVRELIGDDTQPYSSFAVIRSGRIEQPVIDDQDVLFRYRDRTSDLQQAIYPQKYLGTNAVYGGDNIYGVEGTINDIKGQYKPILRGYAWNFAPILVNTAFLIYQISGKQISGIIAVKDGGIPFGTGVQRSSIAALEANLPATSTYDWYFGPDGSYIRMGSSPAKGLTVDAYEGATVALRTAAQIVYRILTQDVGYTASTLLTSNAQFPTPATAFLPSDISATDMAALDAVAPGETGVYVQAGSTDALSVINQILSSAGAWLATDQFGIIRMGQIAAPAGTPVATFRRAGGPSDVLAPTDIPIVSLQVVAPADQGGGLPVQRITMTWGHNYTVQTVADLNGDQTSATDPVGGLAVRAQLALADRMTVWPDNATGLPSPSAMIEYPVLNELTFATMLRQQADAQTLGQALWNVYSVQRDVLQLVYYLNQYRTAPLQLGCIVEVFHPRYGLTNGKLYRVLGYQQADDQTVTLTLWGAQP